MTLPASGTISINSLVGEYGGSAPHSMNEYYRGGSLVPNHSNTSGIPTSGTIQLDDFYGTSASSPTDNQITLSLNGTYAVPGSKFNDVQYGVNPGFMGSFTDNSFTNSTGSSTHTMMAIYQQIGSVTANSYVRVSGNYNNQTFAQAFGYTNMEFKSGSTTYIELSPGALAAAQGLYTSGSNSTLWTILGATTQFGTSGSLVITIS